MGPSVILSYGPARLPEEYVPDVGLRLQIYRRMADLGSMEQIDGMEQELTDRFGPLPSDAQNLIYQLRLKALARDAGVTAIGIENDRLALLSERDYPNRENLQHALRGRASVSHRGIWMPMERGWRNELTGVLRDVARLAG